MNKEFIEIEQNDTPSTCEGLFFRARVSSYINKHSDIVYKEEMRFLSRISCKGCPDCNCLLEEFKEGLPLSHIPIDKNDIKNNGLYRLSVTNFYKSWDGEVDYDLEFIFVLI